MLAYICFFQKILHKKIVCHESKSLTYYEINKAEKKTSALTSLTVASGGDIFETAAITGALHGSNSGVL